MILIAFGTRPEWLKIKPLIEELNTRKLAYKTLFTGQHDMVKNHATDFHLEIAEERGVDRLSNVLSSCINGTSKILQQNLDLKYVLVQGDTTSALGVALAAFHNKVKVIHLEAGLRTYQIKSPFPEEANRQMITRIASMNLCPTELNRKNIYLEAVVDRPIFVVGNTGLDNLLPYRNRCSYEKTILVTLHRRENHDIISQWFYEINNLAKAYPSYEFILPIHPNPNVKKYQYILTDVKVVDPLPHDELLEILCRSSLVISDSGGLQEECSFLKKKIIVCRKSTERPEALKLTSFLCQEPKELETLFKRHIYSVEIHDKSPYGDGKSSEKIVDIFQKFVYL